MRTNVRGFVATVAANLDLPEPLVEIGSLQIEGQEDVADMRPLVLGKTYIGCDMRPGAGVDQIENVEAGLSFEDGSVGTLLCLDTLEHVFDVQAAFREFRRVLRPGGLLAISSVMFFPIHGYPYDYWRFTPECFSRLLASFDRYHVFAEGEPDFPHTVFGLATLAPAPAAFDNMAVRVMQDVRASPQDGRGCGWQPSGPWSGHADAASTERLARIEAAMMRVEAQSSGLISHLLGALQRQTDGSTTPTTAVDQGNQAQLSELRELLIHRDSELFALRAERNAQDDRIQVLMREQVQLRDDLARVRASRPMRLYRRVRAIPGLRGLARRLLP